MSRELLILTPEEEAPELRGDRGITLVPDSEVKLHAPDRRLLLVEAGSLVARCSCWWSAVPMLGTRRIGVIGHYAAESAASSATLLARACALVAAQDADVAVGPMDGNTWRRYRFIVERGREPAFFLEPDNPDDWPQHWIDAGFSPLATYTSAVNDDLWAEDARTVPARRRFADAGIAIRPFDATRVADELRDIFRLSTAAFAGNFLYAPIGEAEFRAQYDAVLPYVRPELVLMAHAGERLAGFVFVVPDLLQARRGMTVDTVIVKTIAVDPAMGGMGVGGVLLDLVQRKAAELGYRRAIHALMHETNVSQRLSRRSGTTFRRYALFSRALR